MKILHLTLKKQWFDAICYGDKREEYREIKPYWIKRLVASINFEPGFDMLHHSVAFKDFDIVRFRLGYTKDAPFLDKPLMGIRVGQGRPEWGAQPGETYFVLELGDNFSHLLP